MVDFSRKIEDLKREEGGGRFIYFSFFVNLIPRALHSRISRWN